MAYVERMEDGRRSRVRFTYGFDVGSRVVLRMVVYEDDRDRWVELTKGLVTGLSELACFVVDYDGCEL